MCLDLAVIFVSDLKTNKKQTFVCFQFCIVSLLLFDNNHIDVMGSLLSLNQN